MKALAVYSGTRRIPFHDSFIDFASQVNSSIDNNNHYPARIVPAVSKTNHSQLVAMAHELRNPLTDINLSVAMLEAVLQDRDLKMYLDIIMRSSIKVSDLITEMLKWEQGDKLQEEQYSIHQLLEEVLEMSEDRLSLKNITVSREYSLLDHRMSANKLRMKMAITNIVINAIDAMAPKKGELKLITKSAGGKFIVQLIDNGCGISKENLANIFKPYFTNKPGGLGIGLSTTSEILQSNNVSIHVKSEEGLGTCFVLMFDRSHGA